MPSIAIPLSLRGQLLSGSRFEPSRLFAANEPGIWYQPSDLTTMFQDRAGTTPVTAPGQSVGLRLDKSKGLVLGSELVTNGAFDTDTDWTKGAGWTISGGTLNAVAASSQTYQFQSFTVGAVYEVSLNILSLSGGTVTINIGGDADFVVNTPGLVRKYLRVPNVSIGAIFISGTGFTGTIDNISVKELPGNHAVANSDTARGVYGIEPLGGRRNLLTYTEQFDNAAWTKSNVTVMANAAVAPDGTTTADAAAFNGTTDARLEQGASVASPVTFSVWMRVASGTASVLIGTRTANVVAVTVTDTWQRFSMTATDSAFPRIRCDSATTVFLWGAQLEKGSTATAYQRVVSQYEVTEAGKPTLHYVQYDGADDGYVTPTITPGTDKVQVFAGVRKLGNGMIAELSVSADANNGSFYYYAGEVGAGDLSAGLRGTQTTKLIGSAATLPVTRVETVSFDTAGASRATEIFLRVNSATTSGSGFGAADAGTGNFLAYPLYIGRRGGTTLPFNGRDYGLIVRFGSNLSAETIAATEAWMNGQTGAY